LPVVNHEAVIRGRCGAKLLCYEKGLLQKQKTCHCERSEESYCSENEPRPEKGIEIVPVFVVK